MPTSNATPIELEPQDWHRYPCRVHDALIVTGDLAPDPDTARRQLAEWVAVGVTDIVDVRDEWSDEPFVAEHAPEISYHWFGTDDNGGSRRAAWFDGVLAAVGDTALDPTAVVLVHCHMGVNRGPSMALRLLLHQGWDAVDALTAIRAARPIANLLYAVDAVEHHHLTTGSSAAERVRDARRVAEWRAEHPIDVRWVISRIRTATH